MKRAPPKVTISKERRVLLDEEFKKEKVQLSAIGITDNQLKYCSTKIVHYIKQLELNQNLITNEGIFCLIDLKWKNLTRIQLMSNQVGDRGCRYLSKLKSNALDTIFLNNNMICLAGIIHLSKAQWPNLSTIVLYHNYIGEGFRFITQAYWMKLKEIHLGWNQLSIEKVKILLLAQWKNITSMGLCEEEDIQNFNFEVFKRKYRRLVSVQYVKLIRHMTA